MSELIGDSFCHIISEMEEQSTPVIQIQRRLLNEKTPQQWLSLLDQDFNKTNAQFKAIGKVVDCLLSIFGSINPNEDDERSGSTLLYGVLMKRIQLLKQVNLDVFADCQASAVLKAMAEIKDLPSPLLVDLLNELIPRFVEDAGSSKDLDLLVPLMQQLVSFERVQVDGRLMHGSVAASHFMKRLCGQNWSSQSIMSAIQAFNSVPLLDNLRSICINKLIQELNNVNMQDLMEFVRGVAKIADKSSGQMFIKALLNKMETLEVELGLSPTQHDSQNDEQRKRLLLLQSAFLSLLKESDIFDPKIYATPFEAVFKGRSEDVFKPFPFSIGLALCSNHQSKDYDKVWKNLCEQVKNVQADYDARQSFGWLRCELVIQEIDVLKLCQEIVNNAKKCGNAVGFLYVLQGMNRLGFELMKTTVKHVQVVNTRLVDFNMSPLFKTCILGRDILSLCAQDSFDCVSATFQRLIRRVLDSRDKNCLFYIDLLKQLIVQKHVYLQNKHNEDVLELVKDMACIKPYAARPLIKALMPLAATKDATRDAIIKSLYSAMIEIDPQVRKVAAFGILQFLRIVNIFGSKGVLSQTQHSMPSFSSSQQATFSDFTQRSKKKLELAFEERCLKALMCLRRCLHYDYSVRTVVYRGLCEAANQNPSFISPVLTLLHQQLQQYIVQDENLPPISINKVTESRDVPQIFLEPLGELIMSLTRSIDLLLKEDEREKKKNSIAANFPSNLKARLELLEDDHPLRPTIHQSLIQLTRLSKKMSRQFGPEDYNWTKDSNFGGGSGEGPRNAYQCLCLVSVFDALIDFTWACTWDNDRNRDGSVLLGLVLTQGKFVELLKEKKIKLLDGYSGISLKKEAVDEDGHKIKVERGVVEKTPWQPCIQFTNLKTMMHHILLEERPSEFLLSLKEKAMVSWLGSAIERKIVTCQDDSYLDDKKRQDTLIQMLRVMLEFHSDENEINADEQKENQSWLYKEECKVMAAHLIQLCSETICKLYSRDIRSQLVKLKCAEGMSPIISFVSGLLVSEEKKFCVKKLLESVAASKGNEENPLKDNAALPKLSDKEQAQYKQCTYFLQTVSKVISCLPGNAEEVESSLALIKMLCFTIPIYDVGVCKCLWQVYFELYARCEIDKKTSFTQLKSRSEQIYDEQMIANTIAAVLVDKDEEKDERATICLSLVMQPCAKQICIQFLQHITSTLRNLQAVIKGRLIQGLNSLEGVTPIEKMKEQFDNLRMGENKLSNELRRLLKSVTIILKKANLKDQAQDESRTKKGKEMKMKSILSAPLMSLMIQHYITLDEFCKYQKTLTSKFGRTLDIDVSEIFLDVVLNESPLKLVYSQIQLVAYEWKGWFLNKRDNQSGRMERIKTSFESKLSGIVPHKDKKKLELALTATSCYIETRFERKNVLNKRKNDDTDLQGGGGNMQEENIRNPKRKRVNQAQNALRDAANSHSPEIVLE